MIVLIVLLITSLSYIGIAFLVNEKNAKYLLSGYNTMNKQQKDELWLLLELNDQELFDLIFKKKDQFAERFPHLKNFAN